MAAKLLFCRFKAENTYGVPGITLQNLAIAYRLNGEHCCGVKPSGR
jgi:hypothetical protein